MVAGLVLATTGCAGQESTTPPSASAPTTDQGTPTTRTTPTPAGSTTGPAETPGGPSPSGPASRPTFEAAGHTFTAADDGVHAHLAPDATTALLQSDPRAADPTVDGDSIELVEVVNVTGSGRREWEVRAVAPGTSVLTVPDDPEAFTITLTVTSG